MTERVAEPECGGPHVRVFTGTEAHTGIGFFACDPFFAGGVRVGVVC